MTPEDKATAYTAAWNSGNPAAVAAHFTPEAHFIINRGDPYVGRAALAAMAAGFHADFPDLKLTCDGMRSTGSHAVYLWTLEGHHIETKNFCRVSGWEEWDLDECMTITRSLGWFDAADYQRQIDGK